MTTRLATIRTALTGGEESLVGWEVDLGYTLAIAEAADQLLHQLAATNNLALGYALDAWKTGGEPTKDERPLYEALVAVEAAVEATDG